MNIQICRYHAASIAVKKDPEVLLSLDGTVKDATDILDPTFTIGTDYEQLIRSANYMYVPDFARYYFITGIKVVRTNLWEVSGHVDVLYTYYDRIMRQGGIIARNENMWNLNLDDGRSKAEQQADITTLNFPSGFSGQSKVLITIG